MGQKPRHTSKIRKADIKVAVQPTKTTRLGTRSTVDIIVEDWDRKRLIVLERLVKHGQYISGEELATAIETNPGEPLPEGLRDYLCRLLRGEIKRKRGRKKEDKVVQWLMEHVIAQAYQQVLDHIQAKRTYRGRQRIAKGELAPHEEAARVIKEYYPDVFPRASPKRIANILSSQKFR
jgi:predicted transcriptional regulator